MFFKEVSGLSKKIILKTKELLLGLNCITFISNEEYEAIQRANNINLAIKVTALILISALFIYAFYKFKNQRKKIIVITAILFVIIGGGAAVFNKVNSSQTWKSEPLINSLDAPKSPPDGNSVPVKCGTSLIKKWWEF